MISDLICNTKNNFLDLFQDSQNILIRSFLRKFGGSKYLFFVWTVIFHSLFVASVRLFLPFIKYHHPSIHKSLFLANSTYLLGLIRNWYFIELLKIKSFKNRQMLDQIFGKFKKINNWLLSQCKKQILP